MSQLAMFDAALFLLAFVVSRRVDALQLLSTVHVTSLRHYGSDGDGNIIHFVIPPQTSLASFRFRAFEESHSIFGCHPRNIELFYRKDGLPMPVAQNATVPNVLDNIYTLRGSATTIQSNNEPAYLNISRPIEGDFFISLYLPYVDPRTSPITQQGLRSYCVAHVDVAFSVEINHTGVIQEGIDYHIIDTNRRLTTTVGAFKILTPDDDVYYMIIQITSNSTGGIHLVARTRSRTDTIIPIAVNRTRAVLDTRPNVWHYLEFVSNASQTDATTSIDFRVHYCRYRANDTNQIAIYKGNHRDDLIAFRSIVLSRATATDKLQVYFQANTTTQPTVVNLTSAHFLAFQYDLLAHVDAGGTLHVLFQSAPDFLNASVPVANRQYRIVGCFSVEQQLVPTWPDRCRLQNGTVQRSLFVVNTTVRNVSMEIPYPQVGRWYATVGLFCDDNCTTCPIIADDDDEASATGECPVVAQKPRSTDCIGGCQRVQECSVPVALHLSVVPCNVDECGAHGSCELFIAMGVPYTACMCSSHYKGWDCSDDSMAAPRWQIRLQLFLLVFSNVPFLLSVWIAYVRGYYCEALIYLSVAVFSSLYHACDAGDAAFRWCITRWTALQFADFYCALLSIWVTLLAIADLTPFGTSLGHVCAALLLSFFTEVDRTALWVLLVPILAGVALIVISWYCKYRTYKRLCVERIYLRRLLPCGLCLVVIGFIIYTTLQTVNNYKYLHSLWHVIVAVSIVLLLPRINTFRSDGDSQMHSGSTTID